MFKIRNTLLALAAIASLGLATLISSTSSADARGFGGGFAAAAVAAMSAWRNIGGGRHMGGMRHVGIRHGNFRRHVGHPPYRHPPLPELVPLARPLPRACALAPPLAVRRPGGCCRDLRRGSRRRPALHLPDQGVHAGRTRDLPGYLHQGARLRSGRHHRAADPAGEHHDAAVADRTAAAGAAAGPLSTTRDVKTEPRLRPGFFFMRRARVSRHDRIRRP